MISWSFLELQFFGLKTILCYPEYQKTIFSGLNYDINTLHKIFDFLTKTMDNHGPWTIWSFLKRYYFAPKSILFYPEFNIKVFSELIS